MLRRHLQRGGALVTACAGFDADTASAYVEHALTEAVQARYEVHLAGCPSCRRHVIELARLRPVTPAPTPVWRPQWKEAVAEWLSRWQWDWRWAGTAAAAACALIIAVLGVQTMQRRSVVSERMVASQAPAAVSAPAAQATPLTFYADLADQSAGLAERTYSLTLPAEAEQTAAPRKEEQQNEAKRLNAPLPSSPARTAGGVTEAREGFMTAPGPEVIARRPLTPLTAMPAPPAPTPTLAASERSSAPVNSSIVQLTALGQSAGGPYSSQSGQSGGFLITVRQGARQDAAPVSPPSEVLKKRVEADILSEDLNLAAKTEARDRKDAPQAEAASRERSARSLKSALKGKPVFGLLPGRDSEEARTKEAKTSEEEPTLKPLFKRVNGKTLFFEHGMWIDRDYKASAKLPLIRLARGSKEYQQTLIENPSLTQFFELGQVVVVWKGKVYEVRK